jgi:hypothetical protein
MDQGPLTGTIVWTFEDAEDAYKAQESGEAYRATIHPHGLN